MRLPVPGQRVRVTERCAALYGVTSHQTAPVLTRSAAAWHCSCSAVHRLLLTFFYPTCFTHLAHPPCLPCSGSSFVGEPPAGEQRIDWGPFWMGCWPFLAAILVTACYFFQAVSKGDPPGFVW